ncbi:MAG: hypothetical protein AB1489_31615 [Acidobacteriota bacterium]
MTLFATKALLHTYTATETHAHNYVLQNAYIRTIAHYGSQEDVDLLLSAFLENPQSRDQLLGPLMILGDTSTAHTIYNHCLEKEQLIEGVSPSVLHCLGYLGYTAVEPILLNYAKSGDYTLSRAACFGLLNLPCEGLENEIEEEIKKCFGKHLFPEFLPALAIKTNNDDLLEQIYELGNTTACTDCNGGIILGVALYGVKGLRLFKEIIWNLRWEADSSSTGSNWCLYLGTLCLGIKLSELYLELKNRLHESVNLLHDFSVLSALINRRIEGQYMGLRFIAENNESYTDLYRAIFIWSDPNWDDSIIGLAHQILGHGDYEVKILYELERRLALRVEYEVEVEELEHITR